MDKEPNPVEIILAHIQGLLDESEGTQPCYYKVIYRDTLEDVKDWIEATFLVSAAKLKEDRA